MLEFGPHEISVLMELNELTFGNLLPCVQPQPNSPPDCVFCTNQLPNKAICIQQLARCELQSHGTSQVTLRVVVYQIHWSSHLCYTYSVRTPKSFHKAGLESPHSWSTLKHTLLPYRPARNPKKPSFLDESDLFWGGLPFWVPCDNWPWVKIQIVPPVNIPTPTKIDSTWWCSYPKMVSHWF